MSAQNLLFSSLPVSNLGLYDSTTQTIQTINSDASGNINLNSNVIVGNTLQTTGGIGNGSGTNTTYNVNAGGSVSAYNLTATNNVASPNMAVTGTIDVANIVNSNSFQGGTGFFSLGCTAAWSALTNLSSVPTAGSTGQIFFYDGGLYFYNPAETTYFQFTGMTELTGPPS
jgi:hypothetical protein